MKYSLSCAVCQNGISGDVHLSILPTGHQIECDTAVLAIIVLLLATGNCKTSLLENIAHSLTNERSAFSISSNVAFWAPIAN